MPAQNYTITTIAGIGPNLGDGGSTLKGRFGSVNSVALGPDGSLYIADSNYSQVRKVANGNITIFAGGPVQGFDGDEGPAISAKLLQPRSLAVDTAGNVYIGELGNHRIRKVTTDGKIHTIAGNGQIAPDDTTQPVAVYLTIGNARSQDGVTLAVAGQSGTTPGSASRRTARPPRAR